MSNLEIIYNWLSRTVRWLARMEPRPSEAEKLAWLRAHIPYEIPNIYAMEGFCPNGCGPCGSCGSCGSWIAHLIPDQGAGLPCWEAAGDWHDYLYHVGGGHGEKAFADAELRRLMIACAPWSRPIARARMWLLANIYYEAVRLHGWNYFSWMHLHEVLSGVNGRHKR